MNKYKVNFYKERDCEVTNETLHCLCAKCAKEFDFELIDRAGSWDECSECGVQNIPSWPSGFLTKDEWGN